MFASCRTSHLCIASVLNLLENSPSDLHHADEDNNDFNLYGGMLAYECPLWKITRGRKCRKIEGAVIQAFEIGTSGLIGKTKQKTAMWLKKQVFRKDCAVSGKVIFAYHVYEYYVRLCKKSGGKAKTKRYIIKKMADVMSIFKIFLLSGKELGRGYSCFILKNCIAC